MKRLLLLFACAFGCSALPPSTPGPAADHLAREMMRAVNTAGWDRTGAVRWEFAGANRHLWDRRRNLAEVSWGEVRALVDLGRKAGRAYQGGVEVQGERAAELLDSAHAKWTNDSYWLNPIAKAFDPGAERSRVDRNTVEGERGLIVRFTSGGRTPGDAYLYWLAGDGRPLRWQLWTSVLPFDGIETSWERWIRISTGARLSTLHRAFMLGLELSKVEGAESLEELTKGDDPFAALAECSAQPGVCTSF